MNTEEIPSSFESSIARLVLHSRSTADLMVGRPNDDGSLSICGLFLKRYNDELPLYFLPPGRVEKSSLESGRQPITGHLRITADYEEQLEFITFQATTSAALAELRLPLLANKETDDYFNISWQRQTNEPSVLLSFLNAQAAVIVNLDFDGSSKTLLLSPEWETRTIPLLRNASYTITCRCNAYFFSIMLRCVDCGPAKSEINFSYINNVLSVSPAPGVKTAEFCIFIYPLPGRRLISGRRTFGFHPGDLLIVVFEPFPPRILHLLSCSLASAVDTPVAHSPILQPQLSTLNLLLGTPEGIIFRFSPEALAWAKQCKVIALFGNPTKSFIDGVLSEGSWHNRICLVSGNAELLTTASKSFSDKPHNDFLNKPVSFRSRTKSLTLLGVPYSRDFVRSIPLIESLLIEAVAETDHLPLELSRKLNHHIRHRLPALPYCVDLAVGIISLAANMLRGRLPSDNGNDLPDYRLYADDSLWLVGWGKSSNLERSELLFELNARMAAEFMAVRSFIELQYEKDEPISEMEAKDRNELNILCSDWYRHWQYGQLDQPLVVAARTKLIEFINKVSASSELVMRCLARSAYEACTATGSFSDWDPYREGISYVNPLVLIFAGGGDNQYDVRLEFDVPYWALFAGRSISRNSCAIVASLFHRSSLLSLYERFKQLRYEMYSDEIDKSKIFTCRHELASGIFALIEEATYAVVDRLAPSRIIVFSDVPLDLLPYADSVLGMEIPSVRYPASGAYGTVSNAVISSNYTVDRPEKNLCAILYASDNRDGVTDWAREVGSEIGKLLEMLFGGNVKYPTLSYSNPDEILKETESCRIVVFLGHAQASESWAGLDVGSCHISVNEIAKRNWTYSFVFLIGCETAAMDTAEGDLASAFLKKGARAVVGTLTKIPVDVASVFFAECFSWLNRGIPADYAFFIARQKAVVYEAVCSKHSDKNAARNEVDSIFAKLEKEEVSIYRRMGLLLDQVDLSWEDVMLHSPTALSLTILGGAGERLL